MGVTNKGNSTTSWLQVTCWGAKDRLSWEGLGGRRVPARTPRWASAPGVCVGGGGAAGVQHSSCDLYVTFDLQPQQGMVGGALSALAFGSQGEARVSLTTLSMEMEVTRVELLLK